MRAGWTADHIERLVAVAIDAGLADNERRSLLLGRLAPALRAALPEKQRPADQLRSDLAELARLDDPGPLDGWLTEARDVVRVTHAMAAHVFDRFRRRRHALLIGADGDPAPSWVTAALLDGQMLVDVGPGEHHRAEVTVRHDVIEAGLVTDLLDTYVEGPPIDLFWLHIAGSVSERRRQLRLHTADRQGLRLDEVAEWTRDISGVRVVLIEMQGDGAEASDVAKRIAALDWGEPDLLAIGPGITAALTGALCRPGRVSGAELAEAMPPTVIARGSEAVIADRGACAGVATTDPHRAATVKYLKGLRADCQPLPSERRDLRVKRLSDIYVPLYATRPRARGLYDAEAQLQRRDREQDQTTHALIAQHRFAFIVGEPGSGKTTTLRRMCEMLCDAHLDPEGSAAPEWMGPNPLPVWLDLRILPPDLELSSAALLDFTFGRLKCHGTTRPLAEDVPRTALADGRLVLILDGLDEIPDRQRRIEWAEVITGLARVEGAKARIWVSCREAARLDGAEPATPFELLALQPFDGRQRTDVIRRWLTVQLGDAERADAEAAELNADLARHPKVDAETGSPLLLTLVCELYFRRHRLPDSRVELYKNLVDLLLENRRRRVDPDLVCLTLHHRKAVLTDLAMSWWQKVGAVAAQSDDRGLGEGECVAVLAEGLVRVRPELADDRTQRYRLARKLLVFFDLRAGLLRWTTTDAGGQKQLGFAHRTFAEYLVAARLSQSEAARKQHLTERPAREPNWREVFVLFTAHARGDGDTSAGWSWVERLADWAADETKPPADRAAYARLAAECLEPCRDLPPRPETVAAVDGLQDILFDAGRCAGFPAAQRIAFWQAIGEHNRLVCGADSRRWVHIPGGLFWRGAAPNDEDAHEDEKPGRTVILSPYYVQRWPVLVREFAEFVDAGGYGGDEKPGWWSETGWRWRKAGDITAPGDWLGQRRGRPTHPVVGVSWWEAEAYTNWLTATDRRPAGVDAGAASLPTEAEWERAARGHGDASAERRYPWGWSDGADLRNGRFRAEDGWQNYGGTNALGAFPGGVSPDGCWAMSGNVWEWGRGAPDARYGGEGTTNPYTPHPDSGDHHAPRVLRGGGWGDHPQDLRVSYRYHVDAGWRYGVGFGFRCVWRVPPGP